MKAAKCEMSTIKRTIRSFIASQLVLSMKIWWQDKALNALSVTTKHKIMHFLAVCLIWYEASEVIPLTILVLWLETFEQSVTRRESGHLVVLQDYGSASACRPWSWGWDGPFGRVHTVKPAALAHLIKAVNYVLSHSSPKNVSGLHICGVKHRWGDVLESLSTSWGGLEREWQKNKHAAHWCFKDVSMKEQTRSHKCRGWGVSRIQVGAFKSSDCCRSTKGRPTCRHKRQVC